MSRVGANEKNMDTPGWEDAHLADVLLAIKNGTTAEQIGGQTDLPVTRIETISSGYIDRTRVGYLRRPEPSFLLQPGDILYSHINSVTHIGKSAIYRDREPPLYHGMNLMLLRPNAKVVLPSYLARVLEMRQSRAFASRECKPAINQASLGKRQIGSLPVSLPPVPEQRMITEILDAADEAIRSTERLIGKLQQAKQGFLHDLLTHGIDGSGHLRDLETEPEQFMNSSLGLFPRDWVLLTCAEITEPSAPIRYGIVQAGRHVPGGVPVAMIRNLQTGSFANFHRTDPVIDRLYSRSRVRPGDLLLSIKGTIGRAKVVPQGYEGNISRDLARIRPISRCLPAYLRIFFESPLGRRLLELAVVGTTRAEVSIGILRMLKLPIPPVLEQQRITNFVEAGEERMRAEHDDLAKLRQLKQGLMDDLLTGRVRVGVSE